MNKINRNEVSTIKAGIKSVCNRGASLQKDIQLVALACLHQTREHGNWTLSRELIEGLTVNKGVKSAKLTQWFEAFMHASYVPNEESGMMEFVYDENMTPADIVMEQAEAINWFDFKATPADKSKELQEIRDSLLKTFNASIKTKKVSESERDEAIALLDRLIKAREVVSIADAA